MEINLNSVCFLDLEIFIDGSLGKILKEEAGNCQRG
jgi:hypothetical protein